MATTEIEIVNQALGTISARAKIASMDEHSTEAEAAKLYYADTRDALLRACPWNFARRVDYLTLFRAAPGTPENPSPSPGYWTPNMPPPGFLYSYYYPADCVKFRSVIPQMNVGGPAGSTPIFSVPSYIPVPVIGPNAVRFVVGTSFNDAGNELTVINTNQQMAVGVWVRRVTNVALWDPAFRQAMVDALACRLGMAITGSIEVSNRCEQLAKGVLGTITAARVADGNEGTERNDHIPDWIQVRGYARDVATYGASGLFWDTPSFLML